MLYGNDRYIFIENFPQKFSPCRDLNTILGGGEGEGYSLEKKHIYDNFF